jgi:prevent-host-death family protein
MRSVQVTDAHRDLRQLLESVAAGEEIIITQDNQAVARLIGAARSTSLGNIEPTSVGAVLQTTSDDDDLLGEMLI